jgi:hypothetical protein
MPERTREDIENHKKTHFQSFDQIALRPVPYLRNEKTLQYM